MRPQLKSVKGQPLPTTEAEAKRLGLSRFFNGKPCKRGHISNRETKGGGCVMCRSLKRRENKILGIVPSPAGRPFVPRPVQIFGNPARICAQRGINV